MSRKTPNGFYNPGTNRPRRTSNGANQEGGRPPTDRSSTRARSVAHHDDESKQEIDYSYRRSTSSVRSNFDDDPSNDESKQEIDYSYRRSTSSVRSNFDDDPSNDESK